PLRQAEEVALFEAFQNVAEPIDRFFIQADGWFALKPTDQVLNGTFGAVVVALRDRNHRLSAAGRLVLPLSLQSLKKQVTLGQELIDGVRRQQRGAPIDQCVRRGPVSGIDFPGDRYRR